ncbi:nucleotidyltransferase [Sorangium sp. So ce385]|uniref:nucleotidyltransferase n=1 Tax=Sorangium sp. So ce385 TaxID=3133308 RepID=UPI003F5B81BB
MNLPPDLVEMLSVFADAGVRYLVIGGHAVSLHARPRTTKDLDLWLDAAPENIGRACAALLRFGVPDEIVANLRAARPDEIVWMGRVPARIDFLQTVPGVEFETSWERRVTANVAGIPVHFIGRDDLLASKRAVGRPQDLRDVRAIERAAGVEPQKRARARRKP